MTKSYLNQLQAQTRKQTDFLSLLLPWHIGGIYTYLSGSLLIGGILTASFITLTLIKR